MTGRLPKPAERKLLAGNPGKRPIPAVVAELRRLDVAPEPPATLGEAGREAWGELWRLGLAWLADSDVPTVELLCQQYDALAEVEVKRRRTRLSHQTWTQLMRMRMQLWDRIARNLGACGFNPSERSRLGLRIVEGQSKLADFQARHG